MDKYIKMTARAAPRLVQQPRAGSSKALDCGGQVRHLQGYMMQSGAVLGKKFRDGRIRRGGFEQLDAGIARGKHGDVNLLIGDGFAMGDLESERFVEGGGGVERFDGDAEMVEGHSQHRSLAVAAR